MLLCALLQQSAVLCSRLADNTRRVTFKSTQRISNSVARGKQRCARNFRQERTSVYILYASFIFFSFVHKPASNIENFKYDLLLTVRFDGDKIKIEIESAFFYFDRLLQILHFISKTLCNIKEMKYMYVINRYRGNIISIIFSNYIILKFNIYIFSLKI